MAIYYPSEIQCTNCCHSFTAELAKSVNAGRTPHIRQLIIEGKFHQVQCPRCHIIFTVEKEFSYTDFTTNTFITLKPVHERHLWQDASAELERAVKWVPGLITGSETLNMRVVFGLAELREKLVAQDHHIDDRHIELLKVWVMYEHPFIIHRPRLRITLENISASSIDFIITYDHDEKAFRVNVPRQISDDFFAQHDVLTQWVAASHKHSDILTMEHDYWVNFWRWSPQPAALYALKQYTDEIRAGNPIDLDSPDFLKMLTYLPNGNHMPSWAKQAIDTLLPYVKSQAGYDQLQDHLFEIRFGKKLEDDWAANNVAGDIDTLWQLFKNLPDSHIAGNIYLNQVFLKEGERGGSYQSCNIYIGSKELNKRERFEDVVRHEIGHAVHHQNQQLIDNWLEERFGWKIFEGTEAGIRQWVDELGGWGDTGEIQQQEIVRYLMECLGAGESFYPAQPANSLPEDHPWWQPGFAPRLAYENTGAKWYGNYPKWYKYNSRAFVLNYWYKCLCIVNTGTLDIITQMPDPYAAMSHTEFFAELYAVYYDLDDPCRHNIPPDIINWFEKNIDAHCISNAECSIDSQ